MSSLVVVATTSKGAVNRFSQPSLTAAMNIKDFLQQTGDYSTVAIYDLPRSGEPLKQWSALDDAPR